MVLPPGLIQIKGRRGYYVNIPVPRALQRHIKEALRSGLALSEEAQRLAKKGLFRRKPQIHLKRQERFSQENR